MRKVLNPGEQLIVVTRRQPRMVVLPVIALLLVLAAVGYAAAWTSRGGLEGLLPWLPEGSRPWVVLAVVILGLWIILGYSLRRFMEWRRIRYVLTSRRLLRRSGGLRKTSEEMPLVMVRDVDVRQSVLQGMLRSGTITLTSAQAMTLRLKDVPEVRSFRQFVLDAIDDLPEDPGALQEGDEITDFNDASLPWELRGE